MNIDIQTRFTRDTFSANRGHAPVRGGIAFNHVLGNTRLREMGRPGEPGGDRETAPRPPVERAPLQPNRAEAEDDVNEGNDAQASEPVGFDEEVPGNRQRERNGH